MRAALFYWYGLLFLPFIKKYIFRKSIYTVYESYSMIHLKIINGIQNTYKESSEKLHYFNKL